MAHAGCSRVTPALGAMVAEGVEGGVGKGELEGEAPVLSEGVDEGEGDALPHVSCRMSAASAAKAAPVVGDHTKRVGVLYVVR